MIAAFLIEKLSLMAVGVLLIVMGYKLFVAPPRRGRSTRTSTTAAGAPDGKIEGSAGPVTIMLQGPSLGLVFMFAGVALVGVLAWKAPTSYRRMITPDGKISEQVKSETSATDKTAKKEKREEHKATEVESFKPSVMKIETKDASPIKQLEPMKNIDYGK